MCKSILTEQFLGATFTNMVSRDIYEIDMTTLSKLEKAIDKSLRDIHNAILLFSFNDVLTTVDEYSDFFQIDHDAITLNEVIRSEIIEDLDKKNNVINSFQQYFTSGIPNSIKETLIAVISEQL